MSLCSDPSFSICLAKLYQVDFDGCDWILVSRNSCQFCSSTCLRQKNSVSVLQFSCDCQLGKRKQAKSARYVVTWNTFLCLSSQKCAPFAVSVIISHSLTLAFIEVIFLIQQLDSDFNICVWGETQFSCLVVSLALCYFSII